MSLLSYYLLHHDFFMIVEKVMAKNRRILFPVLTCHLQIINFSFMNNALILH